MQELFLAEQQPGALTVLESVRYSEVIRFGTII